MTKGIVKLASGQYRVYFPFTGPDAFGRAVEEFVIWRKWGETPDGSKFMPAEFVRIEGR